MNLDEWQFDLSNAISTVLADFRRENDDEMEMFAVDCHPWNGIIALAFLTHQELAEAPFLSEASEMAAWKYYDFGSGLASWQAASHLRSQMRKMYEEAKEKEATAKQFLQRCASVVESKGVQDMLGRFHLSNEFKITIPHPDTNEEYYRPRLI